MSTLRNKMIQQMQLKGYSQKTIASYTGLISSLAKWYNCAPDLLTTDQIREYIHHHITQKNLSKTWTNQLISGLKILFIQVLKREWDSIDVPRPRHEKKLPVILSRQEVEKLFKVTINLKHRALLIVAYSAGLRMGETIHLTPANIDSQRMQIRVVQGKGFKDRYSILSPVTLNVLREYFRRYRPSTFLFETEKGKHISERTVQTVFKNALKKAGINKDVSIHSLRHSFATHLMEQGVSLPVIQQLLGHKSLRTTSVYLHVQQYSIETVKSPIDILST